MKSLLNQLTRLSKWWVLIALGGFVLLAGVLAENFGMLVVGALLAVVGGAGEGFSLLDLNLPRGAIKLRRETVQEATFRTALAHGIPPEEAARFARTMASEIPEAGAPVTIGVTGDASATLSESSAILFRVPAGMALTEEEVAQELAESQAAALSDETRKRSHLSKQVLTQESLSSQSESTLVQELEASESIVSEQVSTALLRGLRDRLDPGERFLIYSTGQFALRLFEIKVGSRTYIGRSADNDLVLAGPQVSRVHALLDAGGQDAVEISNLASTHGVYVNGEKVESRELRDRDVIRIGDFTLVYVDPDPE